MQNLHAVDGFPPDILHDLLEGVIPSELCLCIKEMITKKFFTLEMLNSAITKFPYTHSDKTNHWRQWP